MVGLRHWRELGGVRRLATAASPRLVLAVVLTVFARPTAAATAAATTEPAAASHLLAHATADSLWEAEVETVKPGGGNPAEPAEQTQILVRANRPRQPWRPLAVLPGRATALATRDSQLAVLMADGRWLTVYAEGTAAGESLPHNGRIRTLADDGHTLWALGQVNGGLAALANDRAKATTTATTTVTTSAASTPAHPPAARSAVDVPRLVLFRQVDGTWSAEAQLPDDVAVAAMDDARCVVLGRSATVAVRIGGVVRTLTWAGGPTWSEAVGVTPGPDGTPVAFDLLAEPAGPALWSTTGNAGGRVRLQAGPGDRATPAAPLAWPADKPLTAVPAVARAGNYVRLFGRVGDLVYEQRYDDAGLPVGDVAVVSLPTDGPNGSANTWLQALLLASLAFTVGTSFYRRATPPGPAGGGGGDGATAAAAAAVIPAALGPRAAAGAIDLLPVAGGVVGYLLVAGRSPEASANGAWFVVAMVLLYLAHTTVLEAMTARSVGKWLMGLRVATVDGGRPAAWQLVARNLLRVVDPLVWIALSPMRQRTADVVAGTVVVPMVTPTEPPP